MGRLAKFYDPKNPRQPIRDSKASGPVSDLMLDQQGYLTKAVKILVKPITQSPNVVKF